MSKPKIYLAGSITGLSFLEATEWRSNVKGEIGMDFELVDPMRDKKELEGIKNLVGEYGSQSVLCGNKAIVLRDRNDVFTVDALLAWFHPKAKVSFGTAVEFGWADSVNTPTILVADDSSPLRIADGRFHPFVEGMQSILPVNSFDEAYNVLYSLFNM